MDKKQFTDLLNVINEAYNDDPMGFDDPHMAAAYREGRYPFNKGAKPAASAPTDKESIADYMRRKTRETREAQAEHHIREKMLGLSDEAHEGAMAILAKYNADKPDTSINPYGMHQLHQHLVSSGVDSSHPAMKDLAKRAARFSDEEEAAMDDDKARSRAGL